MDARSQRKLFNAVLERSCIGVTAPEGLGARSDHLVDVPRENAKGFVVVSEVVEFDPYTPPEPPSIEELTASYYVQGVQSILNARVPAGEAPDQDEENNSDDSGEEEAVESDNMPVDNLGELVKKGLRGEMQFGPATVFKNSSDFQKHRCHVAAEYKKMSSDLGLPEPVELCCVESCVANATAASKFCFVHYGLDPNFDKQLLFARCHHVEDGQRCCVPCGRTSKFCTLHAWLHVRPSAGTS
jgi:hypothetical protein